MRAKKDIDKQFYTILDAYKTVKVSVIALNANKIQILLTNFLCEVELG